MQRKHTTTSHVLAPRNVCDRTKVYMWAEIYCVVCGTMLWHTHMKIEEIIAEDEHSNVNYIDAM